MPEERSPEELAAEAEGMTHADMGPPQEELSSPDEGEFLEETLLPSTVENATLEPGSTHTWGSLTFRVEGPFWGGWMAALQDGQGLLVRPGYKAELLEGLGHHRLLPRLVYSGPEGTALEALEGEPLYRPLPLSVALGVVQPLAQLVYFLELKGLALVDLEPQSLRQTPEGPKLALPPRLARLGEPPPKVWRPGYTPPEVLAETTLSGKSGVYLLGALLFELLTGSPLPAEGPSELLLSGLRPPGLPQALARMLAPAEVRATPQEALGLLKRLAQPREVGVVLELGEATTVGLNPGRQHNQDAYAYRLERVQSEFGRTLLLRACVCDGMGGMAAGERASQAAAEGFIAGEPPHPLDDPKAQAEWGVRLAWAANQAVLEALGGLDGGCTLSGVVLWGDRYTLAHVGDSRVYLWRGERLRRLTRDHSLVGVLVESGALSPEEAQRHPDRNQVLRSLGNLRRPQEGYVETLEETMGQVADTLQPGEVLLLLSDGVWGEVEEARMAAIMAQARSPQAAAEALVGAAIEAGAPDNATALLIFRRS
ncbi:Serine/threonine phosphatase stp [Meiothermus luteus]|uniref:Serine/threonine phosphatase stp n=1 Tax=Meiothermus luteus TaxID=2026184 RepID=A0A399EQW7_9DEIN|nr:protein phosphatase 2C domain-containing protein [Meiothermus luteus]RIH85953.1 Serine/threonine phosphatase stp [Meiothermus luteus]RMH54614.1 MAG: serine/threonine-protein phosphatase [Deinococcota bacterium]